MEARQWQEAIPACLTLLQSQPVIGKFHAYLGECYFQVGRLEEAEASFARAYVLDPNLGHAAVRRAVCLDKLRRYREAMDVVKEWTPLLPNDPTLRGLAEFLETQKGAEETDYWEQSRRADTIVLDASFGREEAPAVGSDEIPDGSEPESTVEPQAWKGLVQYGRAGG